MVRAVAGTDVAVFLCVQSEAAIIAYIVYDWRNTAHSQNPTPVLQSAHIL